MLNARAHPTSGVRRTSGLHALRRRRVLVACVAALVVAGAGRAFTAGNAVAPGRAGDGTGTISGYVVTGITYTLNAADPRIIDAVRFTLDAAASTVRARVNANAWATCASTGGFGWSCGLGSLSVTGAATLQIVAAS